MGKQPCPKHASTKYGRPRYTALCKDCVALNRTPAETVLETPIVGDDLDPSIARYVQETRHDG